MDTEFSPPMPSAAPLFPPREPTPAATLPFSRFAIWGFVLAFFAPVIGVILSHLGYSSTKRGERRGERFALASIIVNYVMIVLLPIAGLLFLWFGYMVLIYLFGAQFSDMVDPITFYTTWL